MLDDIKSMPEDLGLLETLVNPPIPKPVIKLMPEDLELVETGIKETIMRRKVILELLKNGPMTVDEITTAINGIRPTVLGDLRTLRKQNRIGRQFYQKPTDKRPVEYFGYPKVEEQTEYA